MVLLITVALLDQPPRRFWHEDEADELNEGWNSGETKHETPTNFIGCITVR